MSYYLLPSILTPMGPNDIRLSFDADESRRAVINNSLHHYLSRVKREIDSCMAEWDVYKKYTNPYEYIHTNVPNSKAAVCRYKPLSRAYFKMIEIMRSLYLLDSVPGAPIRTFHLAEGPGGFIEAVRNARANPADIYHGMTLVSDREYVPGWKKSQDFLSSNPNVVLEYGADGTGDILNPDNLLHCCEKHANSMELITGDGGFDFSVNFDDQEVTASRLVFAQIAYALLLQKKGGSFVVKFFDVFTAASVDFICLLSSFYRRVYVMKPNTSRYANSERYFVCKGFKMADTSHLLGTLSGVLRELSDRGDACLHRVLAREAPYILLSKLEEYNAIIGQQQIDVISHTLSIIRQSSRSEKIDNLRKINVNRCVQWCIKNKQPYHKGASATNIFLPG